MHLNQIVPQQKPFVLEKNIWEYAIKLITKHVVLMTYSLD